MRTLANIAKSVALVLFVCYGASARSETFYDLSVSRIFSEGSAGGGFYPLQGISTQCAWNLFYVDQSTQAGRTQMAMLIFAKAHGVRLQRVDYVKNANGSCTLTGLHVE